MSDYSGLQSLLFKWLKHHGQMKLNRIRPACRDLLRSQNVADEKILKYGLYYLFFPLLHYGLIEYAGNDAYQISPPIIIYSCEKKLDYFFAAINFTNDQQNSFPKKDKYFSNFHIDNTFQIVRFKGELAPITEFANENQIPLRENRISGILSKIPTVLDIVREFTVECPMNTNGFNYYDLNKYEWKKIQEVPKMGLYKAAREDFSKRYFFDLGGKWRKIPSQIQNPDSINIAKCAQGILEGKKFLTYDPIKKQLIKSHAYLPILIDRLLRIPSYHLLDGVVIEHGKTYYKNILQADYKQIKRIFCNSVEIKK